MFQHLWDFRFKIRWEIYSKRDTIFPNYPVYLTYATPLSRRYISRFAGISFAVTVFSLFFPPPFGMLDWSRNKERVNHLLSLLLLLSRNPMLLTRGPSCNQCTIAGRYDHLRYRYPLPRTLRPLLLAAASHISGSLFFSTFRSLFEMISLLALNFEESKDHSTSGKGNRERCGGNVTRFHLNARTLFEISSKVLNDFQRFEDLHFLSHTFRITNFLSIYRALGWSTSEVHFQFPIILSI